jgi:TRL (tRNA-associated locus)-like protein
MKRLLVILAMAAGIAGCANTKDLAKTLRYANNTPVGAENIKFVELNNMKRGTTCTVNLLYFLPLFGDGSIIAAADEGKVNTVELIGETGRWYFPLSTNCTVVFGDKSAAIKNH